MEKKTQLSNNRRSCFFCVKNISHIDYKNTGTLRRYLSSYGKIVPRKRSFICASCQRKLAIAIKRARTLALLPFVNK